MLALLQLLLWLKIRRNRAILWSVAMAFSAAVIAYIELALMHAMTPDEYGALLVWSNWAVFGLLISLIWFIRHYFQSGRQWLAILITLMWCVTLIINHFSPHSVVFLEVTELQRPVTFWGESFAFPVGTTHPWKLLPDLASLLIAGFILDASLLLWRRGEQHRATLIGSMLLFIIIGGVHAPLVDMGLVATPYMISFAFLGIVMALSYDLVSEAVQAGRYALQIAASEERWHTLMENVQLAVVGTDPTGRINYTNPFLLQLSGYQEADLLGHPITTLAPEAEVEGLRARLQRAKTEGPRPHSRWGLQCSSGEVRQLDWSTVTLRNAERRFTGLLSIGADVTDRLRAEQHLLRTRQQMERLGRASILGELASALAHELNQPLAAILANAQAARRFMHGEAPDLDEVQEILDDIIRDDKRAGEVIHSLRAMLGGGVVNKECFCINQAVREVLELMNGEIQTQGVELQADLQAGELPVRAGRGEFQQVVINLLSNALRAMAETPPTQRELQVRTGLEGDLVRVDVEDCGPGVAPEHLPHIFEPFFTAGDEGFGMGLAISRRIVEVCGGRIEATNRCSGGARFSFFLPQAVRDGEDQHEQC
jgi:PAS domain S-box-containing protein